MLYIHKIIIPYEKKIYDQQFSIESLYYDADRVMKRRGVKGMEVGMGISLGIGKV